MVLTKALAFILVGLSSQNALASAGALEQSALQFASRSYLDGSLKLSGTQRKELECLTKVVWFESRGESRRGKMMVANVVLNRMQYGKPFATTVCDVVYQKNQFAWTRDSKKKHAKFKNLAKLHMKNEEKAVMDTVSVAIQTVIFNPPKITSATHFCSIGEKCNFKNVKKLGKIGNHTMFEYLGNAS